MAREKLLRLIAVGVVAAVLVVVPASQADAVCLKADQLAGLCTVEASNNGDTTHLVGTGNKPGSGHSGLGAGTGAGGAIPIGLPPAPQPTPTPDPAQDVPEGDEGWGATIPATTDGVTINDVASFRPASGADHMEPDGWAVIGLDTNFFADSSVQLKHGRLLDQPAEVRFTPFAWAWNYGDGAASTLGTAGSSWKALGVADFDPTPTSHVFAKRGTFTVHLTVYFTADYRFDDGPWTRVPGQLAVPAAPIPLTTGTAATVLVGRDCVQNPRGPGC